MRIILSTAAVALATLAIVTTAPSSAFGAEPQTKQPTEADYHYQTNIRDYIAEIDGWERRHGTEFPDVDLAPHCVRFDAGRRTRAMAAQFSILHNATATLAIGGAYSYYVAGELATEMGKERAARRRCARIYESNPPYD